MPKTNDPYLRRHNLKSHSQRIRYEKFARFYMSTGNAFEAYRQAYPNNQKQESIKVKSYLLSKHPYVVYKLNQINKQLEEKLTEEIIMNRTRILKELEDILNETKGSKKYTSALKALDQISRIVGVYAPEKQQIDHKGITINYIKPTDDGENLD